MQRVADAFRRRAAQLGLPVEDAPEDLTKRHHPTESVAPAEFADLPVLALRIDGYALLIGWLGEDAEQGAVLSRLRSYVGRAAVTRSWLDGQHKHELLLVLAAPEGAAVDAVWEDAAHVIERDDRVCRKLVWLPPTGATAEADSLDHLIAQTFLARPWERGVGGAAQELDERQRLRSALGRSAGARDVAVLTAWWDTLTRSTTATGAALAPGRELVQRLIDSYPHDPMDPTEGSA